MCPHGFADFSLFRIVPRSVRFVGGFAQAWSVTARDYAALMSAARAAGPGYFIEPM